MKRQVVVNKCRLATATTGPHHLTAPLTIRTGSGRVAICISACLLDDFVERVLPCWQLRRLFSDVWTVGDLVRFHTAHKLQLLAHVPEAYRVLGRLVALARGLSRQDVERRYIDGFMRALAERPTMQRHTNVLQHMAGHFKTRLDTASRRELAQAIADYADGGVPLVVPLTLFRHHVRVLDVAYLAGQTYLQPHPKDVT